MTIEQLRETVAEGFNYSSTMSANKDLPMQERTYQAGRAGALMQVLGHLLEIADEKASA
jgi:hypothetical protein